MASGDQRLERVSPDQRQLLHGDPSIPASSSFSRLARSSIRSQIPSARSLEAFVLGSGFVSSARRDRVLRSPLSLFDFVSGRCLVFRSVQLWVVRPALSTDSTTVWMRMPPVSLSCFRACSSDLVRDVDAIDSYGN